jgi:putative transferase (TIGR04331 family)
MYSNIPTILIIKTNDLQLSNEALNIFKVLKKNKISFEDFDEAKTHINKHWKELDSWWKCENVQSARKMFLANYFNVKPNWFKEWSDYIYFSSTSQ